MAKLSPKQEAFCREYVIDHNASKAAERAGYKGKSCTVGPRLLVNVGIKSRIGELEAEAAERCAVTKDEAIGMWRTIWESASKERVKGEDENAVVCLVDYNAACKAADALSRVAGVYEPDNRQRTALSIVWGDDGEA